MTPSEAFKLGFLQKCAAEGLSNAQILERVKHARMLRTLEKTAEGGSLETYIPGYDTLANIGKPLLYGALAAPPALGVLGGAMLSDVTRKEYSPDEAKKREELAEYQRALKAMQQLHARQQPLS